MKHDLDDMIINAVSVAFLLGILIAAILGITFFVQTTQTGPCAKAGGAASFQPDYVQCLNGERVVYRSVPTQLYNYKVKVSQ